MSRTLSYADAVRLLGGGRDSPAVKLLERLTGGLLIAGAAAGGPALLAWLGARTEVARLGHDLVRRLSERRAGLSRLDRTRRLEAAHTVLVVTAFFQALAEAELPFRFAELELTRAEQLALAGVPSEAGDFIAQVQAPGELLPEPAAGQAAQLDLLRDYYANLAGRLVGFVTGLAVWERLPAAGQAEFRRALAGVPACAGRRYQELLRRLAADFPEVAFWAGLREHRATQAEVGRVGAALAELGRMLEEISTGRAPDQRRQALARAYRKALERPVVAAGAVPGELRLPTLGDGYLAPRFRVQPVHFDVKLSDESCWQGWPVRADLQEFLIGQLTSGQATEAALLVLGQPGSGKSVLTRVLAARLPAADFLPVRVVLRDVPATGSVQDQIEHAIRDATGERLDWPALVRSAGDALPVVILDGFDELLQATGVSQSDYLIRVADFQRREADQGRPVAVIVTSRTSVADRARVPEGAVALRLEPFDDERVTAWLALWNRLNAAGFRARGLAPLAAEAVLAHRELAQQPLLLLMLALYDADGNALQRGGDQLSEYELYERLLGDFARREVTKHRPDLPDRDRDRAVEQELRRLSIVALGMVNRGSLWITESDLELDLRALLGEHPPATGPPELRAPLRAAEIVLGRFFFVHRAQATRDDARLETYEFLHATFGEFLVARLTWQVLRDLAAREAAATLSLSGGRVDDDLLHAVLSWAVLSQRAPVIGFLTDRAVRLPAVDRAATVDLLVRLFQAVHQPRGGREYAGYRPRRLPVPARHAAYSANLLLLALCVAGSIRAGELFGTGAEAVYRWRDEAMLWRSQLRSDEWDSLVVAIAPHRRWRDGHRDLLLELDRGGFQPPTIDPFWTCVLPPERQSGTFLAEPPAETLHRRTYLLCRVGEDLAQHALEPLERMLGQAIYTIGGWDGSAPVSAAHAMLDAWLLPLREPTPEQRRACYERCVTVAVTGFRPWGDATAARYARLLLDRLATDESVGPELAADLLGRFAEDRARHQLLPEVAGPLVRCGLAFLGGGDPGADRRIAAVIEQALASGGDRVDPALRERAAGRLAATGPR